MSAYEYKVIPAPTKGQKSKGARSTAERFANALQMAMNELGAQGWEYVRADTLPCEEREGLMGKTTVYQNMLVFRRRLKTAPAPAIAPEIAALEDANAAIETEEKPALLEHHAPEAAEEVAPAEDAPAPATETIPPAPRPN